MWQGWPVPAPLTAGRDERAERKGQCFLDGLRSVCLRTASPPSGVCADVCAPSLRSLCLLGVLKCYRHTCTLYIHRNILVRKL